MFAGICLLHRLVVRNTFIFFIVNVFNSMSKYGSITPGTDRMRSAAGWASPFPLQRGVHTHLLYILTKVAWLPCLLFQILPPPTYRMSARSPHSGAHRRLVLVFDVGTTFSGISCKFDFNNFLGRYLTSWLAFSTQVKFLKSEE